MNETQLTIILSFSIILLFLILKGILDDYRAKKIRKKYPRILCKKDTVDEELIKNYEIMLKRIPPEARECFADIPRNSRYITVYADPLNKNYEEELCYLFFETSTDYINSLKEKYKLNNIEKLSKNKKYRLELIADLLKDYINPFGDCVDSNISDFEFHMLYKNDDEIDCGIAINMKKRQVMYFFWKY